MKLKNRFKRTKYTHFTFEKTLPYFIAIFVLPSFSIFSTPFGFLNYDSQRLYQLIAISSLLTLFFLKTKQPSKGGTLNEGNLFPSFFIFILSISIISSFLSKIPTYSLQEVSLSFSLVLSILLLKEAFSHKPNTSIIIFSFSLYLSITIFVGDFLAGYLWATYARGLPIEWIAPFPYFANVRFFSQIQTWTLPLLPLAIALSYKYSFALSSLLYLISSLWWSLQLATGTRGTWLALIFGFLL